MKKIKIGLVGLMHANFTGDKVGIYNRSIEEMKKLSKQLNFELVYINEGVYTDKEAEEVKKKFKEEKIDFIMIQSSAFNSGTIIPILTKLNVPIGLWAVPEPTESGALPVNSFCAVNMNASIIGQYLNEYDIAFKWYYGYSSDELFIERFRLTVKALTAIKNVREARIALIGGIANGFDNQYYDERKLEKRFGVRLYRNHEFSEIKDRMLSYRDEEVEDLINEIKADSCKCNALASEKLNKNARLIKAIVDFKEENNYDAIAISCWPKFRIELDMVSCAAIGRLNEHYFPTACEGDVYGLVTMMMMRYMNDKPSLLMDLSNVDEKDESVLLWHCGLGCNNIAYKGEVKLASHCNPGPWSGEGLKRNAPVADMIIGKQEGTAARFSKDGKEIFLLTGEFNNPEKPSFDGSRGWLSNLKLNTEEIKVRDLIETIMVRHQPHHYAVAFNDLGAEMMEVAAWLGIKPMEEVKYKHFLQR
jgi:L-fucose isomerase-like protein